MNKFISVLDKIGAIGKDIWKVAEPVIVDATKVAAAVEPEVDLLFPSIAPLYNMTVTLVSNAEASAAAAGANNAGSQKLALVLAALLPYALQEAQNLGIAKPTQAQLTVWVNLVVAGLKTFGSL